MAKLMENRPLTQAEVIDLLETHGILPTPQRIHIAEILFARPQHLAADQVLAMVNANGPTASKATIYNTLGLFAEKGLIREVLVDPSRVFYDPNTSEHHHFYNLDTGELMDIDAEQVGITRVPTLPPGTESAGVDVIVRIRNTAE